LSIYASFVFNLSSIYFISFSASYFPVLPFSAAERNLPKSNASFRISAIARSVPSKIALSLSSKVSDFSLPSSILSLSVSSSLFAISYFYSAVSFNTRSTLLYFLFFLSFVVSFASASNLLSSLVFLRI
jgi:hypothetical protein